MRYEHELGVFCFQDYLLRFKLRSAFSEDFTILYNLVLFGAVVLNQV
jgi:hypothetical protein